MSIRHFFSSLLVLLVAFTAIFTLFDTVAARQVTIDLNPVCCIKNYALYGGLQAEGDESDCSVQLDLSPPDISTSDTNAQVTSKETTDYLAGFTEGLASLGSTTGALSNIFNNTLGDISQYWQDIAFFKEDFFALLNGVFAQQSQDYHQFIDAEFTRAIQSIKQTENSTDLETLLSSYRTDTDGSCTADSIAPECLAERTLCSYDVYHEVLFYSAQSPLLASSGSQEFSDYFEGYQSANAAVIQEAFHAQEALETALGMYSQFISSYRLHLQFTDTIASLLQVKTWFQNLEAVIACVPNKFVGVATTQCN